MPTSTKYANPQPAITFREKSSSSRQNSVESYSITSLNTLDDDVNRLETALGLAADGAEASINYSSNLVVVDGTDPITAIGALDAVAGVAGVKTVLDTAQTGTITVTATSTGVVGVGTTFAVGDVGKYLRTAGGQLKKITAFVDTTHVTLDSAITTTETGVAFTFLQIVLSPKVLNTAIILPLLAGFVPTTNGMFGLDTTANKLMVMINNVSRYLLHDGNAVTPKKYIGGLPPVNTNCSVVTLPVGMIVRDSTNAVDIEVTVALVLNILSAAALGLDTGAWATNTWYYVYLIMKADGTVSAVFSATNENTTGAITLPATYIYKRQLPYAVRTRSRTFTAAVTDICTPADMFGVELATPMSFTTTTTLPAPLVVGTIYYAGTLTSTTFKLYPTAADAIASTNVIDITTTGTGTHSINGNFWPIEVVTGWPLRPQIAYRTTFTYAAGAANPTEFVTAGAAVTFTSVSVAAWVPPFSRQCTVYWSAAAAVGFSLRPTGSNMVAGTTARDSAGNLSGRYIYTRLDASQSLDYLVDASTADGSILDFTITEMTGVS